jgi:hypothetical protein
MPKPCVDLGWLTPAARLADLHRRTDDAVSAAQQSADGLPDAGHRAPFVGSLGVLGAIKTEFGKFGEALEATRRKLEQASRSIESAGVRTRQIERKLKGVEALPVIEAKRRLGDLEDLESTDEESGAAPGEGSVSSV